MTPLFPSRRLWLAHALAALAVAIAPSPPVAAQAEPEATRQVTLFAIIATPANNTIDPKLAHIAAQLRKLLPGHGFKMLDVRSKPLRTGEAVRCELSNGLTASTVLVQPLDQNGKIELRCALFQSDSVLFDTLVATPPNQLFFCDRMLGDGTRLLIGVGAR